MDNNTGYVRYDGDDTKYNGAKAVVDAELKHLEKHRKSKADNLKGLALSGGGIRSASFCLGVMQALAKNKKLKLFDYMSTVSGGGYLGGSLSWLWLGKWRQGSDCDRKFGTDKNDFPYGTDKRHANKKDPELNKQQALLLQHLRQHGKYLIPGRGITLLSFLSVVLRSITMGFLTLLVLASLVFHLLHCMNVFEKNVNDVTAITTNFATDIASLGAAFYILCLLSYGVFATYHMKNAEQSYIWRRRWESAIKYVLIFTVAIFTVALVDGIREFIKDLFQSAGGLSALVGSYFAWYFKKSDKESVLKIIPATLLMYGSVVFMFIGLFVLADQLAFTIHSSPLVLAYHIAVAVFILIAAYKIPINKVSIHRYYRDRLMETFTPDVCKVITGKDPYEASKANTHQLHKCLPDEVNDMPYHIINTNVILVESNIAKFRGRGGDNFILSPLFSGSNATGWLDTEKFADGSITLPTAVAISGAAANSDSGVAGKGLTINPLISILMSIFNLRLGYWTVNPNNKEIQPDQSVNPNYLVPGFWGTLGRKKINEDSKFVQLSDGGHFENLAIYELIRRHCRLIVCCDAEQDGGFVFQSLSNIIEKARVDFGVEIKIKSDDLNKLVYRQYDDDEIDFADQGYLVADIIYPDDDNKSPAKLIYIKTTLPGKLPADVISYKKMHPDFPDETTVDQFFDENQMEAYRMLGMHIAESMVKDPLIDWESFI